MKLVKFLSLLFHAYGFMVAGAASKAPSTGRCLPLKKRAGICSGLAVSWYWNGAQ
ncbi:MAG: hypothetical protein WD068_03060 [Candidatus Babeliales bacterium]